MAHISQIQHLYKSLETELCFAACVNSGNVIHLSGIISIDENMQIVAPGDMEGQVNQIYDIMEKVLAMSRATLQHVVAEVIFATDLDAFVAASATRKARYANFSPPATTGVEVVRLFHPEALLEIQATAVAD